MEIKIFLLMIYSKVEIKMLNSFKLKLQMLVAVLKVLVSMMVKGI
jgi:hypothetical protein